MAKIDRAQAMAMAMTFVESMNIHPYTGMDICYREQRVYGYCAALNEMAGKDILSCFDQTDFAKKLVEVKKVSA